MRGSPAGVHLGSWLGPLALAMAIYGLVWNYLLHFLALGRARYVLALTGIFVGQLAAFGAFHDQAWDLIGVQIATALVTLLVAEWWHVTHHRGHDATGSTSSASAI